MSTQFDPESAYGQQLKAHLAEKLKTSNITEDAEYVAEFLLVLISNNRTADEILQEFRQLFGDAIDASFITGLLDEVRGSQQQQPVPVQQQPVPVQQQPVPVQQQQPTAVPQQTTFDPQQPAFVPQQSAFVPPQSSTASAFASPSPFAKPAQQVRFQENDAMQGVAKTIPPTGPSSFTRSRRTQGGVSKGNSNAKGKKSFALRNQRNFQNLIDKSMDNGQTTQFVQRKPQGRCKHHPHCHNKNCHYAHPFAICNNYPNCPNAPGTCNFLHPGEDDALIAEVELVKAEQAQKKQERKDKLVSQVTKQVERNLLSQAGISLCKFGSICQREECPFAHPTPANRDAKVVVLEWCPANKACMDPNCQKAHSSPNYQPPEGGSHKPSAKTEVERTLEQCKFGSRCKNFRCPKRHATTSTMCRDGANCTRIDCYFMHPLDEDCKFGLNCKNQNCPYRHPEGRQVGGPNKNMVWTNNGTDQRQFAVADDQVMEQAPIQEA